MVLRRKRIGFPSSSAVVIRFAKVASVPLFTRRLLHHSARLADEFSQGSTIGRARFRRFQ